MVYSSFSFYPFATETVPIMEGKLYLEAKDHEKDQLETC